MDTLGEKLGFIALLFTMMSISSSPHPIILIICYGIHEIGHIVTAKAVGAKIGRMRSGIFRLCISYDCSNVSYVRELVVCAGGIIFNLLSALVTYICGLSRYELGGFFPISILDGGGILRCFFLMIFDPEKAKKICVFFSFFFAFVMWLCAVYLQLVFRSDISLFFISVFLLVELCFSV